MPRRELPLVAGEYYHLYNRGNNYAPIFFTSDNYVFFLHRLRQYLVPQHATLMAYVLMPNHFHLLVRVVSDHVSHAMQLLGISYTKAINKRYRRVGSLFQGAFRAKIIDQEDYLLHLSRYIHLNPVRGRLVLRSEDWAFSSYQDYVGLRRETLAQPIIMLTEFAPALARAAETSEVAKTSEACRREASVEIEIARQGYRLFVESYSESERTKIAHLRFGD